MLKLLTSTLWVFVITAFCFDAVAEPCNLRVQDKSQHATISEMPCHDSMAMSSDADRPEAPEHQTETCCCAAFLTNAITFEHTKLDQPVRGHTVWMAQLADSASSISPEFEPPPPRI